MPYPDNPGVVSSYSFQIYGFLWSPFCAPHPIDIESLQNRLLKVCYVLATSAGLNRLLFAATVNSINQLNKAGGTRC